MSIILLILIVIILVVFASKTLQILRPYEKGVIERLGKKIKELNEKQKEKEDKKQKEKNKLIKVNNSKDFINDSFEEKMALKFVEQQIAEDLKRQIDKADSNYLLFDRIYIQK